MRTALLAIDVGGSTTRATLVDPAGNCLGQGRNRGGNPASNTSEQGATAMIAAVEAAVADAGGGPLDIRIALIALAGPRAHVAIDRIEEAFRRLGLTGPVEFAGDLDAMLASVTAARDGYCMVIGTGAGAVRVRNGAVEAVSDAAGWLVGDLGSGFWLGHHAAIAVTAELDGRGRATALTPAVLADLGIAWSNEPAGHGRTMALRQLIDAVYAMRPIELARFAPLVIAHRDDPVAAALLEQSEAYLLADFENVFDPAMPGPVAMGGGVAPHLTGLPGKIGGVISAAGQAPDIRLVRDGAVGSVVLALRAVGQHVDEAMVTAIAKSITANSAARSAG